MSPQASSSGPVGGVMLFWDYDTQWGADRSRLPGGPKAWGPKEFVNTERLLELHARYDVPACFAVVGAAALPGQRPYHDPAQIRQLHEAGHEIASHTMHHEWLPGLDRRALRETLRRSKDALEQCIGAAVTSFVPPYNQPFDYPRRWAFSLSERRQAGRERTSLRGLCVALRDTGYQFCRVAYLPLYQRLAERICRRRLAKPSHPESIAGVSCLRLNTPCGFARPALEMLERCASSSGTAIIYGHPHSLCAGNSQDERWLVPLLQRIQALRNEGRIQVALPRQASGSNRPQDAVTLVATEAQT